MLVEPLESRVLLSCILNLTPEGVLEILGDDTAQVVHVEATGTTARLECSEAGKPDVHTEVIRGVTAVKADLGGGEDRLTFHIEGAMDSTGGASVVRSFVSDSGAGNDTVHGVLDLDALSDTDVEINIELLGGADDDDLAMEVRSTSEHTVDFLPKVKIEVVVGEGQDTSRFKVSTATGWLEATKRELAASAPTPPERETGCDIWDFTGGTMSGGTNGTDAAEVVTILSSREGTGFEHVDLSVDTAGGDDEVFIDLKTDPGLEELSVAVDTGAGDDEVDVAVWNGANVLAVDLDVDTGIGDDNLGLKLDLTPVVLDADAAIDLGDGDDEAKINLTTGVGTGEINLVADGGMGDDAIMTRVRHMGSAGSSAHIEMNGNAGQDTTQIMAATATGWLELTTQELEPSDGDPTHCACGLSLGGASASGGTNGSDAAEVVTILSSPDGTGFEHVDLSVDTAGGDDEVFIDLKTDPGLEELSVAVDTGAGDDEVDVAVWNGANVLAVDLDVDTGIGDDNLGLKLDVTPIVLNAEAAIDLGDGDDKLTAMLSAAVGESVGLSFSALGGGGDDKAELLILISPRLEVDPPASVDVRMDMGDGDDKARLTLEVPGAEDGGTAYLDAQVVMEGGDGRDKLSAVVDLDGQVEGSLALLLSGGDDDDILRLRHTGLPGLLNAVLLIDGGDHNRFDLCIHSPGVRVLNCER